MTLTFSSQGSGDFKGLPAGNHVAVCDIIAYLGIQPGNELYPKPKKQLYVRFEVPAERIEWEQDGKKLEGPGIIYRIFTASMHEKAGLRIFLESWRGRKFTDEEADNFDISTVLGKACMLNAVETVSGGKTRVKIASVSPLPKGFSAPPAELPLICYTPDNQTDFDKLRPWLQEKITNQIRPQSSTTAPEPGDPGPEYTDADAAFQATDQDVPF